VPLLDPIFDARSLSPRDQEDLRRKVVHAVVVEKMSKSAAARVHKVSRFSVVGWVQEYESGGVNALKARKRGRPKEPSLLKPFQCAAIVRLISNNSPDQLRLDFMLWTREAVIELIHKRCGVRVSFSTVGRLLKRWGLTPQKPIRRAYERDDQSVRRWLGEEYPGIEARAKKENAEIYWGDQAGFRSDDQRGRSYSKRGVTPVVLGTGKRFRCNAMTALTNRGQLSFMVFKASFTASVMVNFASRLVKSHAAAKVRRGEKPGKVFLVLDGHPVHKSRRFKAWLAENSDRIGVFFLPGYSPELNPAEYLNHDTKAAVCKARPADEREQREAVHRHLSRRQSERYTVANMFQHRDVRYAAAA
jgi:transposase